MSDEPMIYHAGTGEFVEADPDWLAMRDAMPSAGLQLPTVVSPADLWRRADRPGEAEKIYDAMNAQPVRLRQLFLTAQTYQSDDELWPLLKGVAENLFGADRAAELLAPSN